MYEQTLFKRFILSFKNSHYRKQVTLDHCPKHFMRVITKIIKKYVFLHHMPFAFTTIIQIKNTIIFIRCYAAKTISNQY